MDMSAVTHVPTLRVEARHALEPVFSGYARLSRARGAIRPESDYIGFELRGLERR
jgi:hypothetical protein